jgi:hypothetical protein
MIGFITYLSYYQKQWVQLLVKSNLSPWTETATACWPNNYDDYAAVPVCLTVGYNGGTRYLDASKQAANITLLKPAHELGGALFHALLCESLMELCLSMHLSMLWLSRRISGQSVLETTTILGCWTWSRSESCFEPARISPASNPQKAPARLCLHRLSRNRATMPPQDDAPAETRVAQMMSERMVARGRSHLGPAWSGICPRITYPRPISH